MLDARVSLPLPSSSPLRSAYLHTAFPVGRHTGAGGAPPSGFRHLRDAGALMAASAPLCMPLGATAKTQGLRLQMGSDLRQRPLVG